MSEARNDAAWWTKENGKAMLLVIFTQGEDLSKDSLILPEIANKLNNFLRK